VGLLRLERRPCGARTAVVADRHGVEAPGRFELTIPPGALPTARGAACALLYILQANAGGAIARAELEVAGEARVHVEGGVCWTDRLLPERQARHFHIELTDAALHGGGFIARSASSCPPDCRRPSRRPPSPGATSCSPA
jgi:hypothetical protein